MKATRWMVLMMVSVSVLVPCGVAAAGVGATYTIRSGDSLERIARQHGCSVAELVAANGLQRDGLIHPGQQLRIPRSGGPAAAPRAAAGVRSGASTHKIAAGETFAAVSRAYGIPLNTLLAANPGVEPTRLREGQVIRLQPAPGASAPRALAESRPAQAAPRPTAANPTAKPVEKNLSLGENRPSLPVSTAADEQPVAAEAAPAESAAPPSGPRVRSVMINSEVTFGDFAARYGTDAERLNDLNGLDLAPATVLAKGSELYVPAQP